MTERRHRTRHEDAHTVITLKDLRDELDDRQSFRKNGHTWKEWSTKVFTAKDVVYWLLISVSFVFALGGEARSLKESIATFNETEPKLVEQQKVLAEQQEEFGDQIAKTAALLKQQQAMIAAVTEQTAATKQGLADVNDRIRLNVSRQEFKSALEQQILPRLTRIERAQQAPVR